MREKTAMRYLVASGLPSAQLPPGCRLVADGEAMAFEQPWSFGAPLIARVDDTADLDAIKSTPGVSALLVEGIGEPDSSGQAFAIGAHLMRDPDGFQPYVAGVAAVSKEYGCRYFARGGAVTPLAGSFVPDRLVLMQFASADDAVAFYFSDRYAPLLSIRLRTTVARFVLMARAGVLPDSARRVVAARLPAAGTGSI